MHASRPRNRGTNATLLALACAGFALPAQAQVTDCAAGNRVEGTVVDPSGDVIVGAAVLTGDGQSATTDPKGHFVFACVPKTGDTLSVDASGFASTQAQITPNDGKLAHVRVQMPIAQVNTDISVGNENGGSALDSENGAGTHTLNKKDIQQLADDPDDFKRELQVLAAANGGIPNAATITVDGFQNSSALPPKNSIARIVTAPDMFSSEYQDPPYDGGRVEIYTKPGADNIHGAVFYTDSDGAFNATDPFSTVSTPAGKRRYGFELSGPVVKKKSDYSLALEKRDIDEFNVVNALTLDSAGNQSPLHQTVSAPQRLWIASARGDLQATSTDVFTLSFSANVSNLGNQGVGGLTLADAGYNSLVSEYDLRATNVQTISPNMLHETRVGWTWKDTAQTPLSNAPAVQVSGYFTGGGNTAQYLSDRERDLEVDDNFLYTHGRHSWKIGAQAMGIFVHDNDPDTFNGAFTFGGGTAPVLDANNNQTGGTTTILPIEQYRRALLNLPGGTPTTFQVTTGTALVPFAQWRLALYLQDNIKLTSRVSLAAGLRYSLQTSPNTYANFAPRAGIAWALDKSSKTVLHVRAGLFNEPIQQDLMTDAFRLNGTRQISQYIYNPSYTDPTSAAPGSVSIATTRAFPNTFRQFISFQGLIGAEHDFPHHWHAMANFIYGQAWNDDRSRNINAPILPPSIGTTPDPLAAVQAPRPYGPGRNIFIYDQTGHLNGRVVFLGLDQHSYKRFGFFAGYLYFHFTGDSVRNGGFVQNAYSNQGENSRPDWQATQRFFAFGNYNLPYKASLSIEADAQSGSPYTFTTGTDANGDGNFNDRPSYASAMGPGVVNTRFGLLTSDTVNGDVPRALGTMPGLVHLDVNLSRAWQIGGKKDSPRTLTLNARSANLLNHTNVTAVGSVVSSPNFTQSVAAESARRLELGARFQF